MTNDATKFLWKPQPEVSKWLNGLLFEFCNANPDIAWLADRMRADTGTRLVDWVDFVGLLPSERERQRLTELGFVPDDAIGAGDDGAEVLVHPDGSFPAILLLAKASQHQRSPRLMPMLRIGIRVDSVRDFLEANRLTCLELAQGEVDGQLRQACISQIGAVALWVVERHGWRGFNNPRNGAESTAAAVHHLRAFRQRSRDLETEALSFDHAEELIRAAVADLGKDWACDLFFQAERDYWLTRNKAARVQYERQSQFGLGWANHDHHTYRSSREGFHRLIHCLELLGCECRERFYAGEQAGWGAQVLEQKNARIIIFADVDLSPTEIEGDIAHDPLQPKAERGTVGTWCKLHGEAFLEAGMHHLECQFDFDAAREQLAAVGIETMAPFTDFPYLRQAFTVGEMWQLSEKRLKQALEEKVITQEQAERFRNDGGLGSHLEILERNDGYKGFNQTGISEIILRTDPRA